MFSEPSDTGIIPPEYRTPSFPPPPHQTSSSSSAAAAVAASLQQQQQQQLLLSQQQQQLQQQQLHHHQQQLNSDSNGSSPRTGEKKPHQWSTNPVEEWAKEQVINYLINCLTSEEEEGKPLTFFFPRFFFLRNLRLFKICRTQLDKFCASFENKI